MPPKAKTLTEPALERLGCKAIVEETKESTYTIRAKYNTPQISTSMEHIQVAESDLLSYIKDYMPQYSFIEVVSEQTGEVIYSRYASYDFFNETCSELDNFS